MNTEDFDQTESSFKVEEPIIPQDPLSIKMDDDKLIEIVDKWIIDAEVVWKSEYDLPARRKKNEEYLFGRQVKEKDKKGELKEYNSRFLDNVIYEAESDLKPLALARMPDLIVLPGDQTNEESKKAAKILTEALDTEAKTMEERKILGLAFKHHPVYFIGAIKPRWIPEKGKYGDYGFEVVHPNDVILDPYCPTSRAEDMSTIAQRLHLTIKDVIIRFPEKKKEFLEAVKGVVAVGDNGEIREKDYATPITIEEVWFTEYTEEDGKWEKIQGVVWKYKKCLLKKMRDPNWDWEGEKTLFTYDEKKQKQLIGEEQLRMMMMGQMDMGMMQQEEIYHNYFENPKKPYIFLTYDQWGRTPLDQTSRIEQNIPLQENLDKRGRQITEMLDRARGKHVWSKDGNLKAEDIEEMDMSDPEQDVLLDGDVNKVHAFIPSEQPSQQMFKDLNDSKDRIMQKTGVNAITGEVQSDVATTNQIAREANFTKADDLVEETVNYAVLQMNEWKMQFIKLRYTEKHLKKLVGKDGQWIYALLDRDMVEDGMEIKIKSSSTDKLRAEKNAKEMAQLKMIDPLSYYEDVGAVNPKERTERLMLFMQPDGGAQYIAKFVMGQENTGQMVDTLNGAGSTQAIQDIMMMQQGQMPQLPQTADPGYIQAITQFLESPEFAQLPPELQQQILAFAKQLSSLPQGAPTGQPGTPPTQVPPPTGQPMPTDTANQPEMQVGIPTASPRNL